MDSLLTQQSLNVFRWEEELAVHCGAVVYLATLQKNKAEQDTNLFVWQAPGQEGAGQFVWSGE